MDSPDSSRHTSSSGRASSSRRGSVQFGESWTPSEPSDLYSVPPNARSRRSPPHRQDRERRQSRQYAFNGSDLALPSRDEMASQESNEDRYSSVPFSNLQDFQSDTDADDRRGSESTLTASETSRPRKKGYEDSDLDSVRTSSRDNHRNGELRRRPASSVYSSSVDPVSPGRSEARSSEEAEEGEDTGYFSRFKKSFNRLAREEIPSLEGTASRQTSIASGPDEEHLDNFERSQAINEDAEDTYLIDESDNRGLHLRENLDDFIHEKIEHKDQKKDQKEDKGSPDKAASDGRRSDRRKHRSYAERRRTKHKHLIKYHAECKTF